MINKLFVAAAIGAAALGAQASSNLLPAGDFEAAAGFLPPGASYCYDVAVPAGNPTCGATTGVVTGWKGEVYLQASSGPWGDPGSQPNAVGLGGMVAGIQGQGTLASDFVFTPGQTYDITWVDAGRNYGGSQSYTVTGGGVTDVTTFTTSATGWTAHSFEFTAASGTGLVFQGLSAEDRTSFIDNVVVVAVPEPAAMLMMAAGALGLLAWRRRPQA